MKPQILVNLHVKDLTRSMDFYSSLGFTNNPQFTDNTAACMVLSEEIFVMLVTHDKFKEFTPKQISDSAAATEVINALSVENKEKVNELADIAIANGGTENKPPQDYGFMYLRSFNDLDGHIWELFWMNPDHVK